MGDVPGEVGDELHAWLSEVLGAYGRLTDARVEVIGQGEGFVGQLGRVELSWSDARDDAPSSVVVKLPTSNPGGRAVGQMMGLYARESRFYSDLAATAAVRVPHCYVNIADPATDTWALVLEDLAPLVPGDQVAGADLERARIVVQRLAHLHAQFYGHPDLGQLDWIPSLEGPTTASIVPMFEASWSAFLDHYGPTIAPRVLDWIERFAPSTPAYIESFVNKPATVCHGDFRLDNMFFGPDGEFALIDWQLALRAPGSSDLVYFLIANLTAEVRQQHQWELIDLYLDTLLAEGVAPGLLSRDDVVRGYREGALLFGVMFVSTMTLERSNARGEALFDALVGRTAAAIDDLGSGELFGL
jgi:hypothetical protein